MLLVRTHDAGGRYAVCFFGMTLRSGNREYFFSALDRDFPGIKEAYLRNYGNQYFCLARDAETLARRMNALRPLGLAYTFGQINRRDVGPSAQAALPAGDDSKLHFCPGRAIIGSAHKRNRGMTWKPRNLLAGMSRGRV